MENYNVIQKADREHNDGHAKEKREWYGRVEDLAKDDLLLAHRENREFLTK